MQWGRKFERSKTSEVRSFESRSDRDVLTRPAKGEWQGVRGNSLIVQEQPFVVTMPGEKPQIVKCRMRSLGCSPCTGAIRSDADTVPKIINELIATRQSERQLRIIDHDQDGSMEIKKREGYF